MGTGTSCGRDKAEQELRFQGTNLAGADLSRYDQRYHQ